MPQAKNQPLYLVDGSGYIFRAFYAIQPLTTQKGFPTNALLGFTRMLAKLVREVEAEYVGVAFDTKEPTFRHELYPEYKANRKECPEELVPQLPLFRDIVEAAGMKVLQKPGVEADDIIGTIARRMGEAGQKVIVVSGDKDLTQLVNDHVEVWDAMRDVQFTREQVKEKFGVFPEQIVDYLALIGDSSDNVPGVKGIGPKTAERLLEHFGSLDVMLEKIEEIETIPGLRGAKSVRGKIESSSEMLRLSRRLVLLDYQVEPFNSIENVEELHWQGANQERLAPLFEELEFHSLVDVFKSDAKGKVSAEADIYASKAFEIVTAESLPTFAERLAEQEAFAFDTESSSFDFHNCDLLGISISWEEGAAYYLPLFGHNQPERHLDPAKVRELLGPIFADPKIRKYGANIKFDVKMLEARGYKVAGIAFDTMVCAYVIDPDKRDFGLKALTRKYLNERMREYKEVVGKCEHLGHVDLDDVSLYACHDAEATWRLTEVLDPLLGERSEDGSGSCRAVFEDIEMPLVPVLVAMEQAGIKVDAKLLGRLGARFSEDLKRLETSIHELAGEEFNVNSPKQLSVVLFEKLGLPIKGIKKTQSGFTTNAAALERLSGTHEIIERIQEYRELHKLNSTYVEALQRLIEPATGRIHASFNQAVAATGRLSSSDPNLQNIPIRNARGRMIRAAFVAEPGQVLISADYSQIELRVLAHMSADRGLVEAFRSGEDIHARTARELFGADELSGADFKDLRRIAKTINFGLIYGMGAFRLASELGISRKQAQAYIDEYFARYPGVGRYFDAVKEGAERDGFVTTVFGRRRYRDTLDVSGRDEGYAMRSMMNAPIQGTAAEIIKIAMVRLHERLAGLDGSARIVLQVHDELVVEADEQHASRISEVIVEEMENAVTLSVPLKVDVRVGPSWAVSDSSAIDELLSTGNDSELESSAEESVL